MIRTGEMFSEVDGYQDRITNLSEKLKKIYECHEKYRYSDMDEYADRVSGLLETLREPPQGKRIVSDFQMGEGRC